MVILCLKTAMITFQNQLVLLLISPSEQRMQSKQHTGSPFFLAMRVPGGQLSLHTERGGYREKNKYLLISITLHCDNELSMICLKIQIQPSLIESSRRFCFHQL